MLITGAEWFCAWESSDGEDHFAPTTENYVNEEAGAEMRFSTNKPELQYRTCWSDFKALMRVIMEIKRGESRRAQVGFEGKS